MHALFWLMYGAALVAYGFVVRDVARETGEH